MTTAVAQRYREEIRVLLQSSPFLLELTDLRRSLLADKDYVLIINGNVINRQLSDRLALDLLTDFSCISMDKDDEDILYIRMRNPETKATIMFKYTPARDGDPATLEKVC